MPRKPAAKKRARGRPTKYTEALAERICERLSDGESLRSICDDKGMPAEGTVRLWSSKDDHPFSAQYAQARQRGYLKMAEELLDIADDGSNDYMLRKNKNGDEYEVVNHEHVQRSRLRVDTRKWLLSKVLPKIYGDRVVSEITGKDGGPVEINADLSDMEVTRRVAFLLGKAAGKASVKSDATS